MAGLFVIFLTESCNYPALLMLFPLAANLAILHRAAPEALSPSLPPTEKGPAEI